MCKTDTTLSTNEEVNEADLNKLIKLLEDKKPRIKYQNSDGGYFYTYLDDKSSKNWIKMIKIYKKLLELYK